MPDIEKPNTPDTAGPRSQSPDMYKLYKKVTEEKDQETVSDDESTSIDSPSQSSTPTSSPRLSPVSTASPSSTDSASEPESPTDAREQLAGHIYRNHLQKLAALEILESLDFKVTARSLGLAHPSRDSSATTFLTTDGELEFVKELGSGNNAKVYAVKFNGDAENYVVKAFNFKKKHNAHIAQKDLMKIIIERNLLRKDQQDARIFYDPTNKQVYLVMPRAKGVEATKVFADLARRIKNPEATEQERIAALGNAFRLLNQILARLEEFGERTKHLHGDAHMGNVYVQVKQEEGSDVPNYEVSVIDYGGCCPINTTCKEYISLFSPLGGGDSFTAPEMPTKTNNPKKTVGTIDWSNKHRIVDAEYGNNITEKADLHAIVGSFVFGFILELLDENADQCLPAIAGTKVDSVVQKFLEWSLTYCCNSDAFMRNFGSGEAVVAAKGKRNKILKDLGYDVSGKTANSLGIRNNFKQARAQIQRFVKELEKEREREGTHIKKGI